MLFWFKKNAYTMGEILMLPKMTWWEYLLFPLKCLLKTTLSIMTQQNFCRWRTKYSQYCDEYRV